MDPVDIPESETDSLPAPTYATVEPQPEDDKFTLRAWYKHLYDMHDISRMAESAAYLRNILETQGPFDVSASIVLQPITEPYASRAFLDLARAAPLRVTSRAA